jgi:hypothetical protein
MMMLLACDGEIRFSAVDAGDAPPTTGGPCAREQECPSPLHCETIGGTCERCVVDAHCGGATPRCDAVLHVCVECAVAADCTEAATTCDTVTHQCRSRCSAPEGCPAVSPVCDDTRDVCIGCVRDTQCVGRGTRARCELGAGRCVECLSDVDCKAPGRPKCDIASGDCVFKS